MSTDGGAGGRDRITSVRSPWSPHPCRTSTTDLTCCLPEPTAPSEAGPESMLGGLADVELYDNKLSKSDRLNLKVSGLRPTKSVKASVGSTSVAFRGGDSNLELTTDEPREYLQPAELMFLAFKTDTTRVATYQIGRENGVGRSDHLARPSVSTWPINC